MKLLPAMLLLALPTLAAAQDYRASILYVAPADSAAPLAYVPRDSIELPHQSSLALPIIGGVVGGMGGMFGGLVVGAGIDYSGEDITPGMVYGLLAGEILLLPVGVHLANGARGNFLKDFAVSALVGSAAAFGGASSDNGAVVIVGAVAQLAAVVAVERGTAQANLERRQSVLARADPAPATFAAPESAAADSLPPFHAPLAPTIQQPSVAYPIALGTLAGVAGAAAGIAIGAKSDDYYDEIPEGAIVGYFIGESLCMPLGVHLGNQGNGSLAGDLGLSVLGHLAAIALGSIGGGTAGYAIGMAGTVALTVANERAVGRRRLTEQANRP